MRHSIAIVSIRTQPEYLERAIRYFQDKWATPESMKVYDDCFRKCIVADNPLPQWYILLDGEGNNRLCRLDYQRFQFANGFISLACGTIYQAKLTEAATLDIC